jgi:predicted RNA-binding Zn-ribbon protein involved in translation (DUF1610 family)
VSEEGSVWKCRSCGAAWDEAPTDTTFWCPSCGAWDVHGKVVMDLACTCQMVVGSYSPPGGLPGTICPCEISANCRFTRSEAYALRELSPMKEVREARYQAYLELSYIEDYPEDPAEEEDHGLNFGMLFGENSGENEP